MTTAMARRARPAGGFHPRPIGKAVSRPGLATPTDPRIALCVCSHENRGHGLHGCRQFIDGHHILGIGRPRRRRCPCVRFVEAPFDQQQIPLFDATSVAEGR